MPDGRAKEGTYYLAHLAARAYDAAAWRLGRPANQMNFDDVTCVEEAEMAVPHRASSRPRRGAASAS